MEYDECRECVTKIRDHSKKEVYECPYCRIRFCMDHSKPKLVHIPNFGSIIKDKVLESKFRHDYSIDGNHPCFQYTMAIFDEMTLQDQIKERLIKEAIDRMMEKEPWWKKFQNNKWKEAFQGKPFKQPKAVQIPVKKPQKVKITLKTVGEIILGFLAILGGSALIFYSIIQNALEPWLILIPLPIPIPIPIPIPVIGFLFFFAGIGIIGKIIRGD